MPSSSVVWSGLLEVVVAKDSRERSPPFQVPCRCAILTAVLAHERSSAERLTAWDVVVGIFAVAVVIVAVVAMEEEQRKRDINEHRHGRGEACILVLQC